MVYIQHQQDILALFLQQPGNCPYTALTAGTPAGLKVKHIDCSAYRNFTEITVELYFLPASRADLPDRAFGALAKRYTG